MFFFQIRFLIFRAVLSCFLFLSVNGNGAPSVVINEIMYHPPEDLDQLQFVELYNHGGAEVDLSNWSFSKGIQFSFPQKTKIPPGTFLVLCRDSNSFTAHYGKQIQAIGNFKGKLSRSGDRLELSDAEKKLVDAVKYSDRGDWPISPDGNSSSLERIAPSHSGEVPANWASSKLPNNLKPAGTPGRRNDNFSTNLPPIISELSFPSTVPTQGQPVRIQATVRDAEGVSNVTLLYQVVSGAPNVPAKELAMRRISGDEKSGTYIGELKAGPPGELVRFRIRAVDLGKNQRIHPSENEPRPTLSFISFAPTNTARIPLGFMVHTGPRERAANYRMRGPQIAHQPSPTRGNGYFVYLSPETNTVELFDHVRLTPRKSGYKIHFLKGQSLRGMSTVNILFEESPRHVLAEPLAYELYRRAGVPSPYAEHIRIWQDGRLQGYHLLVEQPNKAFLERNQRDPDGNLYKLLWYGQNMIDKHEKKTNLSSGHEDLIKLIEGLNRNTGPQQWEFIQAQFNVEEVCNYFAVNMCIQNWDGFFNNYYAYHDLKPGGKWEIIPWDEDKTWGDYDGAQSDYPWHELPLSFGMSGDRSPRDLTGRMGQGPFGGVSWWRPPGFFSGPLLSNPQFRQEFLRKLDHLCRNVFTEDKFIPVINSMEKRMEAEVQLRAQALGENARATLQQFQSDMESFRRQVQNRRKFLLAELAKSRP